MRVLLILTLFNLVKYVILAQFDIINDDIRDLQLSVKVGNLPLKYSPLSEDDQKFSDKAADVVDLIPLVSDIDPLVIPVIHVFGIDDPSEFLRGQVNLENFVLSGGKQLQLNDLELRLSNLRGDINITVPKLHVEADFKVRISQSFLPLMLSCHLSAYLFDVGVVATGGGHRAQSPGLGEVLQIESAAINVDISDVVFNLTHLVWGVDLEDYDHGPVTQLFESRSSADNTGNSDDGNIFNGLLKKALGMVNEELFQVPIADLMEFLTF